MELNRIGVGRRAFCHGRSLLAPLPRATGGPLVLAKMPPGRRAASTFAEEVKNGPGLADFIRSSSAAPSSASSSATTTAADVELDLPSSFPRHLLDQSENTPKRKVFMETYGCQMNSSDSEIVMSIMQKAGYEETAALDDADIIFVNTCAIRDNAERKVWDRLNHFKNMKRANKQSKRVVGVLGCMAERLKSRLLESDKLVDLVVGPDAYRSLPSLLTEVESGQTAMNVQLSMEETYADIRPVRTTSNNLSAYLSIMRGCNNMCSYCIVPFTRGRERSRPIASILDEVRQLSDQGVKEVVLLGQNVNSYNDLSEQTFPVSDPTQLLSKGFGSMVKPNPGGVRFTQLMDQVSRIDPEMRVRFTSPHPKDFPDDLLHLIAERPNLCNAVHIPAQSGNSEVLHNMRRFYTREAYLELIQRMREVIPNVGLSSDFISGFCGETEEHHQDTLSLLREVRFDQAFMFAYSMREKTNAHRTLQDNVPEEVKQQRLKEVIQTFFATLAEKSREEIGRRHLVLVEGTSRRSSDDLMGRTDNNKKVVFPNMKVDAEYGGASTIGGAAAKVEVRPGDYVVVEVESTTGITLLGRPLARTTLSRFAQQGAVASC